MSPVRRQLPMAHILPHWTWPERVSPRADNLLRFQVDGPGEIVATDNGDLTRDAR